MASAGTSVALVALLLAPSDCRVDQTPAPAAPAPSSVTRTKAAACEKALRAAFRRALTDPDDPDEADPPVPPACKALDRVTRKRIADKVIFEELPKPCPTARLRDCEG